MQLSDVWVDEGAHLLHFGQRAFPCDRDVEAVRTWKGHALLLSSDTDCLSLWDSEGLVRTARVGIYPQDMAVQEDTACICGGADGKLHLLSIPSLHTTAEYLLPGMPERIYLQAQTAHVLTLLSEPELHTVLLWVDMTSGEHQVSARFSGLPGVITADTDGLWIGVSELVMHLPFGTDAPDMVIEGIGLARHIDVTDGGITVTDALEGRTYHFCIRKERSPCDERPCV